MIWDGVRSLFHYTTAVIIAHWRSFPPDWQIVCEHLNITSFSITVSLLPPYFWYFYVHSFNDNQHSLFFLLSFQAFSLLLSHIVSPSFPSILTMSWSTHSSPSLLLKLLQLALNESKLKSNPSRSHQSFSTTLYLVSTRLLKKYWFLVGLAIVISLAVIFPDVARYDGYLHAEWTIKWGTQNRI